MHKGRPHFDGDRSAILRLKAWEMAPKLIAAFALVLYDQTDLDVDSITALCNEIEPLYERAEREGWDIRKNCLELTGIDCFHYMERGKV